jgi:hypothetical protein
MSQPGLSAEGQRRAEPMLREGVERVRSDHPAVNVETAVIEGPPAQVLVDMSADVEDQHPVSDLGPGGEHEPFGMSVAPHRQLHPIQMTGTEGCG